MNLLVEKSILSNTQVSLVVVRNCFDTHWEKFVTTRPGLDISCHSKLQIRLSIQNERKHCPMHLVVTNLDLCNTQTIDRIAQKIY